MHRDLDLNVGLFLYGVGLETIDWVSSVGGCVSDAVGSYEGVHSLYHSVGVLTLLPGLVVCELIVRHVQAEFVWFGGVLRILKFVTELLWRRESYTHQTQQHEHLHIVLCELQ